MGGLPNVFNAEGANWRNQRRWDAAAAQHSQIDLSADLKRYTVDIIAGLTFGQDVNTLESGDNVIQQHLDCILPGIARRSLSIVPRCTR